MIRAVHMNSLRGLLGVRRVDRIPNALILLFCEVTKLVNERMEESVLRLLGHIDRRKNCISGGKVYEEIVH